MTDIHAHILPGVDDGSDSMETSLEMAAMAADSGVTDIISTNHCNIPGEFDNYLDEGIRARFERLRTEVRRMGIPVKLHTGMEVFATEALPDLLKAGRVWTLAGTSYFLTEFAFGEDPAFCRGILESCRKAGFRPVIAHPERYYFIQEDPAIAYGWCVSGAALQINKGSILGHFGKAPERTAHLLLSHGLAACTASDAHGIRFRTTRMGDVRDALAARYGADFADLLVEINPKRILEGKPLYGYEPLPF
ncbi:MAG: hypothetical protein J6Z23_05885 [Lachnospiraceae bacterium]|nr:hypothetical protein [Lachnospiraceae bacterium]